ncbi:hypothetical protein NQ318_016148 [Aromia moschata]|uniref:Uncharacterized protein n=1 Tax=Aromia moschata TaxID=1265417 RepID=A0AAV8Y1E2_9CUCU|nr:hypothetical protein NQ318_016148 [Aromia moschata]
MAILMHVQIEDNAKLKLTSFDTLGIYLSNKKKRFIEPPKAGSSSLNVPPPSYSHTPLLKLLLPSKEHGKESVLPCQEGSGHEDEPKCQQDAPDKEKNNDLGGPELEVLLFDMCPIERNHREKHFGYDRHIWECGNKKR